MAVVAACFLIAVSVLAGTSAGSSSSTRASAPRLIAHDTSGFGSVMGRPGKPGPQLLRKPRVTKQSPIKPHNDSAMTNTSVLNPSADIGKSQLLVGRNGRYTVFSRTWVALGGSSLGFATNASFWSGLTGPDAAQLCATNPQGEPSVAYDWNADRWVVSEAAYALDSGSNPTGAYVQCVAV